MYVLQEMRVMPCYLYNELFGECNEEKCTVNVLSKYGLVP